MTLGSIYLNRNYLDKFYLYYRKALYVIESPTNDSNWEAKLDWKILKLYAEAYLSLYNCKHGKLDISIKNIEDLKLDLYFIESQINNLG